MWTLGKTWRVAEALPVGLGGDPRDRRGDVDWLIRPEGLEKKGREKKGVTGAGLGAVGSGAEAPL